jgi:protein-L-isoaspartate(D-aspartate) O-methyltransferase
VLEIGTGCGYQAAVIAEIAEDVYSVEIVPELARQACANLKRLGYDRVCLGELDGTAGWSEHAPYDAILVAAAPEQLPEALTSQLKMGGRLIIPLGREDQQLHVITRHEHGFEYETVLPVQFVPMIRRKIGA